MHLKSATHQLRFLSDEFGLVLAEGGQIIFQVGVLDLAVELDDEMQLSNGFFQVTVLGMNHGYVKTGDALSSKVA